jgi:hypothetical protein
MEIPCPSHPPVRDEILKFYASVLKDKFGFDYWYAQNEYHELGNEPGIYPDVALLLFELIDQYEPRKIVEIGSGFSTLVLSLAAHRNKSKFISYDQYEQWRILTAHLLYLYEMKDFTLKQFDIKTDNNIIGDADFVFVDFMDRAYMMSQHADWFKNVNIMVYDDSTLTPNSQGLLYDFMTKSNRHNFCYYNGGGRMDRVEFISFKKMEPEVDYFIAQKMGYL